MVEKYVRQALALVAVLGCVSFPWAAQQDKGDDGTNPTLTTNATRGLVHTHSAETMGAGRLSFSLFGSWYKQETGYPASNENGGTPNSGSDIISGTLAFSFGVNPFFDVFALGSGFGLVGYHNGPVSGPGSVQAGVMGALPLPEASPFHLGAQLSIIGGTSTNQIDSNGSDGYDYFETRTGYDFMGRVLESVVFGKEAQSFKIHLNEGVVYSLQTGKSPLLLLGIGFQGNVHEYVALGLEANTRTFLDNLALKTDPLWITPSVIFRTPFYMNFMLGGDIRASQQRSSGALRALELFRIFGGIDFTFDLLSGKRKADREAKLETERKAALEKEEQAKKEAHLKAVADGLAQKVKADSIAAVQAREAEKRRADSLAVKAKQDSIALVETKQRLREEMSKRSDMEKQLLSTGLLLLDAVYFESGRTEISINSKPYLNIIGKMLLKYPKLQLEIGGHTDNIGGYEMNKRLSYARAESVRQYLVIIAPDLAGRLTANGYGPDVPKADNRSAAGRKVNRRVELQVTNKDMLKEYNP
jgi:outer membrane protein OmpA-like peptidoglycan-associated protein